jgi:hypothetical protein
MEYYFFKIWYMCISYIVYIICIVALDINLLKNNCRANKVIVYYLL